MNIGETFKIEQDGNGWVLWQFHTVTNRKTKETKTGKKPRYFATMEQCCNKVIDLSAANAETAQGVIDAIHEAQKKILAAIHESGKK